MTKEKKECNVNEAEKLSTANETTKLGTVNEAAKLTTVNEIAKLTTVNEAAKLSTVNEATKLSTVNETQKLTESKHTKKLREEYIHFTDDFMFTKVMGDMDLCKEFLETILGEEIDGIVRHDAQKYLATEYDAKSMRLDVYTETAITMINTEMQKSSESEIGKRSRYSGSLMDSNHFPKGLEYKDLKARYVIFICTSDPFKKGLCQYTFESMCREDKDVELNNGIIDIVINLKGDLSGISEEFKELIEYMGERKSPEDCSSPLIHKIHKEVELANRDPELRRMHMTVGDKYKQIERESHREGVEQGLEQGVNILVKTLSSLGFSRDEAIEKVALQYEKSIDEIKEICHKG